MAYKKSVYVFIKDDFNHFYRAIQLADGTYEIIASASPYPITFEPENILKTPFEFATNKKYFGLARSVSEPLTFIKDGAAIMRYLYYNKGGTEAIAYVTITEWSPELGHWILSTQGKVDFNERNEDPKSGRFTVNIVDDSPFSVLQNNDGVDYSFDCSAYNPKAIRVLIDGVALESKITWQTVQAPIINNEPDDAPWKSIPFVIVNNSEDAAGIITNSQGITGFQVADYYPVQPPNTVGAPVIPDTVNPFFETVYPIPGFNLSGSFSFIQTTAGTPPYPPGGVNIGFSTNKGKLGYIHWDPTGATLNDVTYNIPINITWDLEAGEKIYFYLVMFNYLVAMQTITPFVTNVDARFTTRVQPQVVYGIRAVDFMQDLVLRGTNGRFIMNSEYLSLYKNDVLISGDSLRQVPNARIYSSFEDFFNSFNPIYYMALRIIQGDLFMEKVVEVYNPSGMLFDIGDALDLQLITGQEYKANEISIGSPKTDTRRSSGRLDFHGPNTFSFPLLNSSNKIDAVSKYKFSCYDITFLLLDYQGASTKDNPGDKSVYILDISNDFGTAIKNIPTFALFNMDDALLEPIIKSPREGARINNDLPSVSGVCNPGLNINIYVDGILDGNTVSAANGDWLYNIVTPLSSFDPVGSATGAHLIQATFTDLLSPSSDLNIIVDTTVSTPTKIIYPAFNDSLYNHFPLIQGVAPPGIPLAVIIDGVTIGAFVDNSGRWKTYPAGKFTNGTHTIQAGMDIVTFFVDADTEYPLITYIGSELDGFPVWNNIPLIRGVSGNPGSTVKIWLDYLPYVPIGTATVQPDFSWEFQTIPTSYNDPLSGTPIFIVPIPNGQHVLSTSLQNHVVPINVQGYTLNRPVYTSVTGVPNNTVFNTRYTPKRMLENWSPILKAIGADVPYDSLRFETADKNSAFATTDVTGKIVVESADVPFASMGSDFFFLEQAIIKVHAKHTFAKALENFNAGGVIKSSYRGQDLYFAPIGSMRIPNIKADIQEWTLMFSVLTPKAVIASLYYQGIKFNIMQGSIFHSDYNSLHFTKYAFTRPTNVNSYEIYDGWWEERNAYWLLNPTYIQKYNNIEYIRDQIVANGVTNVRLDVHRCSDGRKIDEIPYVPVVPSPLAGTSDTLMEARISFTNYQNNQVFFVMSCESGTASSGTLTVPFTEATSTDTISYTFAGLVTGGEIVRMTWSISGNTYIRDIATVAGWTIPNLNAAIKAMLDAEPTLFVTTVPFVDPAGNNGLSTFTGTGTNPSLTVIVLGSITQYRTAISERVETREFWTRSIIIRSSNTTNKPGMFFSTGYEIYIRIEGLVKKMQPNIETIIAHQEDGDTELIYSMMNKKRTIRFGNASGMPDYLYMKVAAAIMLDKLRVENIEYTLMEGDTIEPSEDVPGYPLYYYDVNLTFKENAMGVTFATNAEGGKESVVIVLDSEAVGLPSGQLIDIELGNP